MTIQKPIPRTIRTAWFSLSTHRKARLVLSLMIALTSTSTGCKRVTAQAHDTLRPTETKPSAAVRLSVPEKTRFLPEILATGNLRPERSAQLATVVPGTLARLFVRRGDEVKSFAPLAALEASGARAALAQAEAGIVAAKAQLALADDALNRMIALSETGAITEAELVRVKGQRELAAAQLQSAIAQCAQARVLLGNHTLVAPFAGVIVRAPDAVGSPVGPQSTLFILEEVRTLVLETSLSQEEVADLRTGAKVTVVVAATGARVDDAKVRLIVPSVDQATNRVPIEITVPNAERRLLPHAFARALLPSGGERDAFRVPQSALTQDKGAFSLWMVGLDNQVITVRVRVFTNKDDGFALVDPGSSGFPAGARVIDSPPLGLTPGTKIPTTDNQGATR